MMKKMIVASVVVALGGVGYYALSPLWMNKTLDEALPIGVNEPLKQEAEGPAAVTLIETEISEPISVLDTPTHPASGVVRVVKTDSETVIRYENYKTINGPDVRVYLANDLKATDYLDLGPIKGTEGNINYPVPAGVDVSKYRYVLTWCEDFSVLFNSADLSGIH